MMKKFVLSVLILFYSYPLLFSNPDLAVSPGEIVIEQGIDSGYHLWIKKKSDILSVLITESTADPNNREHSYSLRAEQYNSINGDERRILNGEFLDPHAGIYSLIDSTPEKHETLGDAFHIFIPYIVVYGYSWNRQGEIQVLDGTFLNVRSFNLPYADYSGPFSDNPFIMKLVQLPREKEEDITEEDIPEEYMPKEYIPAEDIPEEYMPEAVEKFTDIAEKSGGKAVLSKGKEDLVDRIAAFIDESEGDTLDLVLALDTTRSMRDEMPVLKEKIVPFLSEHTERFSRYRVGLIYYRDYYEDYLVKPFPFSDNLDVIQRNIDSVQVNGGRDNPEAVYEALYKSLHYYDWTADTKLVILIGDAPPHPRPRGNITKEMVFQDAGALNIKINTIILPE